MPSRPGLRTASKTYEVELGFLQYENASNRISFPFRIRERHLTPETKSVRLQAIGPALQISVWSERDNIIVRIPFDRWQTSPVYEGTFTGANDSLLTVGRFEDSIEHEEGEVLAEIAVHGFDEP